MFLLTYFLVKNFQVEGAVIACILSSILYGNIFYLVSKKYIKNSILKFNFYGIIFFTYLTISYYMNFLFSIIFLISVAIILINNISLNKYFKS